MPPNNIDIRHIPPDPRVDPQATYRQRDPQYLRQLLLSVDPGPLVTVDADRDGYLDGHWLTALQDIRRGFSLQNELYRLGHISRVRIPPLESSSPDTEPVFDYLHVELVDGEVRVFAYFDDPAELAVFKEQVERPDLPFETVAANVIEHRPGMTHDVVDPDADLPENFSEQIPDVNRPLAGNSQSGSYYRIDVTDILQIPPQVSRQINQPGLERSNCANLVLMMSGLESRFQYVDGPESFVPRLQDPEEFQAVSQAGRGDVVVWYKAREEGRTFIHTFIDLGNGWALTKDGSAEENPIRFQRIETLRYLYAQDANRAQIYVAYYAPKWVIDPDHYGWTRDGGAAPPPYRPMIEERYRPVRPMLL